MTFSDWSRELSDEQVAYAAQDAWATLRLGYHLGVVRVSKEPAAPKGGRSGAGPLPAERKGKLWQWGASVQAKKEEENRKKMEAFGKVMQEKQERMQEEEQRQKDDF